MNESFNPNAAADPNAGIFGLPHSFDEASLVYLPIPWEATTSYGGGTALGPNAILGASVQLDFFDLDVKDAYQCGLHCIPLDPAISSMNEKATALAQPIKDAGGNLEGNAKLMEQLREVNALSAKLNAWVKNQTTAILSKDKIPAIIGGDHSVPFGAFQAAAEKFGEFGILHFDAHSDTRKAYMGFEHSHASIMFNASTQIPEIKKFVQVGIRDFCEEEFLFTGSPQNRFQVFYDQVISKAKLSGDSFKVIAEQIISHLPAQVWVSFDIDGLDPRYCPHTGTPVPGGLDYSEAIYILTLLARSGKKIIGFDVVEVAPPLNADGSAMNPLQANDEWDANVGMRLIYKLSGLALASQGKAAWRS